MRLPSLKLRSTSNVGPAIFNTTIAGGKLANGNLTAHINAIFTKKKDDRSRLNN